MKITDNDRVRIAAEIEEIKREIIASLDKIKDWTTGNDLPQDFKDSHLCTENTHTSIDLEIENLKQNVEYVNDFIEAWERITY